MSPSPETLYPYRYDTETDGFRHTKVYLAGPMRGYPAYNFPAFQRAAAWLRAQDYVVWSPAEYDLENGFDLSTPEEEIEGMLRDFMKVDLPAVLDSDAIVLLPGWEGSTGASLEQHVANVCGIPSYVYPDLSLLEGKHMAPDQNLNGDDGTFPFDFPVHDYTSENGDQRIVTNPLTGGQKETRPARFDLLPWDQLWKVAELYAYGASKYTDRNWEQGYQFSLSIAALQRHMAKFSQGESYDKESGQHHLASVVFHALALMRYEDQLDKGYLPEELDDRPGVGFDLIPEDHPNQLSIEDLLPIQQELNQAYALSWGPDGLTVEPFDLADLPDAA